METFKTSKKTASAANGPLGMDIDDDDISDEYDFAESDEEAEEARRAVRKHASMPHNKYIDILQQVANRQLDEITIELDDLWEVCITEMTYDTADESLLV